ncbi:spermatogenesis-associated protein 31G1 isoform X2 [Tenrec ecaudatus]|uniref:spermatogenesis-associated protein 31G1 isoform X2 n=1 Tax=Tenrec ecaudatus TaxID=94439 RepID=UPI003F59CB2C
MESSHVQGEGGKRGQDLCQHSHCLQCGKIWQIRRWWYLGRWPPFQPCCSGDKLESKGLPLQYHVVFLDWLWKQKSTEEEEEEEEVEKDRSLGPLKPYSPPKEVPIEEQPTITTGQPSCGSEAFPKAPGTPEQMLTQPLHPSRSFPPFQILTNLPARHTTASGNCLQQRKRQLFWGLPTLHSEFLEATFLNVAGCTPLKSSTGPIFFNNFAFLPKSHLLLPQSCPTTQLPIHQVHTMEDLEGLSPDPELPPPLVLSPALHSQPLPAGHKGVLSSTETHAQLLLEQRETPRVSKDQAQHPQPELQRTSFSKNLPSVEAWQGVPWDPSLQQLILDSCPASPLYPSSPLGVLTRLEPLSRTMEQSENVKDSESAVLVPSPTLASLTELQEVNPLGNLSGSKASWEAMGQRENAQTSRPPAPSPCHPQGTSALTIPPEHETQWRSTTQRESLKAFKPPVPAPCQTQVSFSKCHEANPEERLPPPKDLWRTIVQRESPQGSEFPAPVLRFPRGPQPELHRDSTLGDPSGCEGPSGDKEESGNPWIFEPTDLDLNSGSVHFPEIHETRHACVPLGSEPLQDIQKKNLWVSADPFSSLSPPSSSLLASAGMGSQGILPDSKALCESMGQRENLWVSNFPGPAHSPPLALLLESHRRNSMEGFPGSEVSRDLEYSSNPWPVEPESLVLNPHPALALEPESFRVNPTGVLIDSQALCGGIERRKNSTISELPGYSFPQGLHGVSLQRIQSDSGFVRVVMEQKNSCAPGGSLSLPLNSMSMSHINESPGNPWDYMPMGQVVEQKEIYWATELPVSAFSPLFVLPPEGYIDWEFVWRKVQQREVPQGSSPPIGDRLQPMLWPSSLGDTLKNKSTYSDLLTREAGPSAKVETPPHQEEARPEMPTHPGVQTWQWSRELLRLKYLQKSRALGQSQSFCSSPTASCTIPGSWELFSCPPQQAHPPNPGPYSSRCSFQRAQGTVPQSPTVQVSRCHQPHTTKQMSDKVGSVQRGTVVQAQEPCVHMKAGNQCQDLGVPSSPKASVSGEKLSKASSALLSAQKRGYPKNARVYHRGAAGLVSSTGTGKLQSDQTQRLVGDALGNRLSPRSQPKIQRSLHSTLPKTKGPHNMDKARMEVGGMTNSQHCKHYKKRLSSPSQAPLARALQGVLAKCLSTLRPQPTKSNQQREGWQSLTPSISRPEAKPDHVEVWGEDGKQRKF